MNEQARKFCKRGALNFKPANSSTKVSGHFSQTLFGKSSTERKRADEVLLKQSSEVWEEDVYTQSDWKLQSLFKPTELLEYWWEVIQSSVKKSMNSASIKLVIISLRLPEDGE